MYYDILVRWTNGVGVRGSRAGKYGVVCVLGVTGLGRRPGLGYVLRVAYPGFDERVR